MSRPPTVLDRLAERALAAPDREAFSCRGERLTFGQWADQARRAATVLAGEGLGAGDRGVLASPTGLEFVPALYGILLAGASAASLSPALPPATVARRAALVRARVVIVARAVERAVGLALRAWAPGCRAVALESILERSRGATPCSLPSARAGDPALLLLTSGTTGDPKAAVIPHRSLMAYLDSHRVAMGVTDGDVLVNWSPLHHNMGLVRAVFGTAAYGWRCALVPPGLSTTREWLETVTASRGTVTAGSDFGYRVAADRIDPAGIDLSSLRYAISGGEGIRLDTIERFERRYALHRVVRPGYGLSETTLGATALRPGEPLRVDPLGRVSSGRPLDGVELLIAGANGETCAPHAPGEILVRGALLFAGYFDDPDATRAAVGGGWFRTGDVGFVDEDGYLYVLGRSRALIKRGGVTIVPRDVEDAACAAEGVLSAAAVGARLEREETESLVVVAEAEMAGASDADRRGLAEAIGRSVVAALGVVPSEVVIVGPGAIPRTENGKIRYGELRQLAESGLLLDAFRL